MSLLEIHSKTLTIFFEILHPPQEQLKITEMFLSMNKEKIIINQPIRLCNYWSNNDIEYENKGDRNKKGFGT